MNERFFTQSYSTEQQLEVLSTHPAPQSYTISATSKGHCVFVTFVIGLQMLVSNQLSQLRII